MLVRVSVRFCDRAGSARTWTADAEPRREQAGRRARSRAASSPFGTTVTFCVDGFVRREATPRRTSSRSRRRGCRSRRAAPDPRRRERRRRVAVRRFCTVAPVRPAPVFASLTVAHDEAAGQSACTRSCRLHVVHLPPPGPEALVVEARRDVGVSGGEGHVGDLVARAGQSLAARPHVRPGRAAVVAHVHSGDGGRNRWSMKSLAHWIAALVLAREVHRRRHERRVVRARAAEQPLFTIAYGPEPPVRLPSNWQQGSTPV